MNNEELQKHLEEQKKLLGFFDEIDEAINEVDEADGESDAEFAEVMAQADKMLEGYEDPHSEFEEVPQPEQLSAPKEFKTKVFDKRLFEQHKKAADMPQSNKMSIKL